MTMIVSSFLGSSTTHAFAYQPPPSDTTNGINTTIHGFAVSAPGDACGSVFLQDVNVSKATCHVWHTFTTQGAIMVYVNMLLAKHDHCGRYPDAATLGFVNVAFHWS
jgi:hypothetical protein